VCEKSVGPEKTCDFRTGKMILQQEISAEQVHKLLSEGKTDLLEGFVSSRTNRKFKAYLVKQANGKIGFEFEPRPAKAGAKTAGKAASKTAGKAARDAAAQAGTATKKTAAKKTAAKKTAAKKAAVKKTATKKAAAKKTAAKTAAPQDDDDPPF
jgi:DNA topoisomerase-3